MLTFQGIFDRTVRHLHAQGGPAYHPQARACAYRAQNGRKCAAGFWIKEDDYNPEMEGRTCSHETVKAFLPVVPNETMRTGALFSSLQMAHDNACFNVDGRVWTANLMMKETRGPDAVAILYASWAEHYSDTEEGRGIATCLTAVAEQFGLNSDVVRECWPPEAPWRDWPASPRAVT
jgi:hypothetical protein